MTRPAHLQRLDARPHLELIQRLAVGPQIVSSHKALGTGRGVVGLPLDGGQPLQIPNSPVVHGPVFPALPEVEAEYLIAQQAQEALLAVLGHVEHWAPGEYGLLLAVSQVVPVEHAFAGLVKVEVLGFLVEDKARRLYLVLEA